MATKRISLSIDAEKSRNLSIHSVNMSRELDHKISKQKIVEVFVDLLNDKKIYKSIINIIKENKSNYK